ncbi:MAG: MCE family protein [Calditrichaeota bacterium]|nr:MCE family protein [Calditrichota bacterium]
MPTRAQKIRLAIFTLVSLGALLTFIIIITSQKFLKKKDVYYIAYENVSVGGLEVGSPVKYLGINVGTIEDIRIDPENVNRVIVKVALEPGTPIKNDSRADIVSIGITGLKTIEIRGGSREAPLLKPGAYILPGSSITEEITGKAEVIAEKVEALLNNLQEFTRPENLNKITLFAENANQTLHRMNMLIEENRALLHETLLQSHRVMGRADSITRLLQASAAEIYRITSSDTLRQILANTQEISVRLRQANLAKLILDLGKLVERTNQLLLQMDQQLARGSEDFLISMRQLRMTLQNLNEASRFIQEDPSVLIRGTKFKDVPDEELER